MIGPVREIFADGARGHLASELQPQFIGDAFLFRLVEKYDPVWLNVID
jgi:hypothetical protein